MKYPFNTLKELIQAASLGLLLLTCQACSDNSVKKKPGPPTRPKAKTQVKFSFGQKKTQSKTQNKRTLVKNSKFKGRFFGAEPLLSSEINCFGVLVTDQNDPAPGICYAADNLHLIDVFAGVGSTTAGTELSLTLDAGLEVTFSVVGLKTDAACPDLFNISTDDYEHASHPLILGSTDVTLVAGTMQVEISAKLEDAKSIEKCEGGLFNWENRGNNWDFAEWDLATWGE